MQTLLIGLLALFAGQSDGSPKPAPATAQDLRIETRLTTDLPNSSTATEIVSIKGARQRRERIVEWPPHVAEIGAKRVRLSPTIVQCDKKRTLFLNDDARIYGSVPIEDRSEHLRRMRRAVRLAPPRPPTTKDDLTITIDSVDTGERRKVGSYIARHVVTTTKTEYGSSARAQTSTVEQDGWYIDLPSFDCESSSDRRQAEPVLIGFASSAGVGQVHVKHLGTAPRGHPLEETRRTAGGSERIELIQFSETPLDPSLFDIPAGYRWALPLFSGGFDLTKPDTLINRVGLVWHEVRDWTSRFFR